MAAGDAVTEIFVEDATTLDGETIDFALFTPFTRGVLVINPQAIRGADELPETATFTGFNEGLVKFTGCSRGRSSIEDAQNTDLIGFHPVGTEVIIGPNGLNYEDMFTYVQDQVSTFEAYVDAAVAGSIGTADDDTSGSTFITENLGTAPRAMAALVSAQASPNMTLKVNPFKLSFTDQDVSFAGGNTGTMVAPVTNPRIDLVVYSTGGAAVAVRTGAENASPVKPTPTTGDIVLATVYHKVGETSIHERNDSAQGYIQTWYTPSLYNPQYLTQNGSKIYAADSVGTDAYAVTLSPAVAAYTAGLVVNFKAGTANTGAATLAVNGLSADAIKKNYNQDLNTGDILQNQVVTVIHDGTNWQLQSPVAGTQGIYASGTVTNLSTTTAQNNDVTVTTGFTPRFIKLYYYIQGYASTAASKYVGEKGTAMFTGTTLTWNEIEFTCDPDGGGTYLTGDGGLLTTGGALSTVVGIVNSVNDTSSILEGNTGTDGIRIVLSINSVSSTGFVIRRVTTVGGTPSAKVAVCVLSYEAYA